MNNYMANKCLSDTKHVLMYLVLNVFNQFALVVVAVIVVVSFTLMMFIAILVFVLLLMLFCSSIF